MITTQFMATVAAGMLYNITIYIKRKNKHEPPAALEGIANISRTFLLVETRVVHVVA